MSCKPVAAGFRQHTAKYGNAIGASMKRFALVVAAMAFSSSAFALGVDSNGYNCAELQALIAATRYIYINNPSFRDFVVANASYCSGGEVLQLRSVPTRDNPECLVNYCRGRGGGGSN
jgi:hypothetical protein